MQAVQQAEARAEEERARSGITRPQLERSTPVPGAALLATAFVLVLPRYRLLTKQKSAAAVAGRGPSTVPSSQHFVPVSRVFEMMRDLGFQATQQQEFSWKEDDLAPMARQSQACYKRAARSGAADGSGNKEEKSGVVDAKVLLQWLQLKWDLYQPALPERLVPGVVRQLANQDSLILMAAEPSQEQGDSSSGTGSLQEPLLFPKAEK
jgi:hypothetical protein